MGKLILILAFVFIHAETNNKAEGALRSVFELEEVQSYFNRSPRFTTSHSYSVILLKDKKLELYGAPNINSIPVKVVNITDSIDMSKVYAYIQLNEFQIKNNKAKVNLELQNAKLLLEDQKKVKLMASLKRVDDVWQVEKYDLEEINIFE